MHSSAAGSKWHLPRIVQNAVLDSVQRVASRVHRVADDLRLARRNVAAGLALERLRDPQMSAHIQVGPVIGGIAGDDAVIILRVTLRLGECLLAALRASAEIGMRREARRRTRE